LGIPEAHLLERFDDLKSALRILMLNRYLTLFTDMGWMPQGERQPQCF